MKPVLGRQGDFTAGRSRRFVPAITILIATLVMVIPLPLAWGVTPQLGLLLLIFWASVQPRLLPPWGALLLGIFTDAALGLPLGIWTVIYPAVVIAVQLAEARMQQTRGFVVDWALALLLCVVAMFLQWEFLRFAGTRPAVWPLVAQTGVTILAYPLVVALAARVQNRLAEADR